MPCTLCFIDEMEATVASAILTCHLINLFDFQFRAGMT